MVDLEGIEPHDATDVDGCARLSKDWPRIWKGSRELCLWSSQDAADATAVINMLIQMTFHREG